MNYVDCVFDQALYAKATEVVWKHLEKYEHMLSLGLFHTICTLFLIIGKRFQDVGLRDLCVGAVVLRDGCVAEVMEGRQYNQAVRLRKVIYEVLM